jgi:DHA2 family multidrug resistance protein-like MFS transporter
MSDDRATGRSWCGLLVLLLPAVLTSMDISVLFVAGPAIADALHPSATQWLWTMDVYSFVMAGLLITMGSLGDRIGRRKVLLCGAAIFGVFSIVIAYAPNSELLILGRAILAIGGATLAPSTLSLIRGMFTHEDQRRVAVGSWTIAFVGGAVAGPIIGGALLEHFWWGAVFLINVPAMLLLLVAGPILIVESKNPTRTRFDLLGSALSLLAVVSLVFTMTETVRYGISLATAGSAIVGVGATVAFVTRQNRISHPLIDLTLFRIPAFSAAVGVNTTTAMVISGLGVLAFPFMQVVHGLTPLQSALCALPTFAGSLVGASAAAAFAAKVRATILLIAGLLAATAGFAVVTTIQPQTGLWEFLTGYTTITLGIGLTATIANSLVLKCAPPERAGAASGISETSSQLGSALGIATIGTVADIIYRSTMDRLAPLGTNHAALESVTAAVSATQRAGNGSLRNVAFSAYTDGVTAAAMAGAALTAAVTIALVLAAARRRNTRHASTRPVNSRRS